MLMQCSFHSSILLHPLSSLQLPCLHPISCYSKPLSIPIHLHPMELQLLHSSPAPLASLRSSSINPFYTLSSRRVVVSLESSPPLLGNNVLSSQSENRSCFAKRAGRRKKSSLRAASPESVDVQKPSSRSQDDALGSGAQSHLDLLERMTQNSGAASGKEGMTIAEQLSNQVETEAEEVVISLSNVEKRSSVQEPLTISQKRNIRRQDYLNRVSERNDAPFFATVAAFVLLPPVCILGFAIATGYVELFP